MQDLHLKNKTKQKTSKIYFLDVKKDLNKYSDITCSLK